MNEADELAQALVSLADAFDALSVTWAIGGSLASSAHGEPRSTNDVDVIALLDEARARRLTALLSPTFYADADATAEAVRARGSFSVIDNRSILKIDVFVPADGPLGAGQLDRRRSLDLLPGVRAFPVLGPEEIVLQKLRWYQLGGAVSIDNGGTSCPCCDRARVLSTTNTSTVPQLREALASWSIERVATRRAPDGMVARSRIFVGSKAPWDHIAGDAPQFDGPPG